MLIQGFGQKLAFFHLFILGHIGQENEFYDILDRKNAFLVYKKKFKKSKNVRIFQRGWFMVLVKSWPDFYFFYLRPYRPGKMRFTVF